MADKKISALSAAAAAGDADLYPVVQTVGVGPLKQTGSALKTYFLGSATAILSIAAGKTVTLSNTLTLTGTDGNSFAFPSGSDTVVTLTATQTLSGKTFVAPALGTPASGVATNLTGTAAGLTAGTVTTNANLTGPITSSGNATSVAAQTGTGTTFVMNTSPVLVTPNIGTPSAGVATNLTGTAAGLTSGNVTTNANLTGPITSIGNATSVAAQTGTGTTFVMNTSPVLITPALGTPSSGVATNLTGTASGLTAGTVTTNANLTGPITSSGNATSIASQTGTGTKFVVDTSPTLVTPILGVATATSINKLTLTAPATSATITITDGKTLAISNTLTLAGTDGQTFTFPTASDTVACLGTVQTFTAAQTNSKAGAASTSAQTYTGTPFAGTGTTSFPLVYLNGGTGPTTFNTGGVYLGINSVSGFAGNYIEVHANGGATIFTVAASGGISTSGGAVITGSISALSTITASALITGTLGMSVGNTQTYAFGARGILSSPVAGSIQLGSTDAASPVAQILRSQSVIAGTADTAGQNWTVRGSLSTGSGTSGDIILQTGGTGASSTVQNTATTALTIKGATQAVVVASGKTFQLGNAATTGLTAGVLAATTNASIVITDSTGQAYRIPCII